MRKLFVSAWLALLVLAAVPLRAQQGPLVPVKMQVVFTEFDGEKKVGSQPYTFYVNAGEPGRTQVRMGVRVPIYTGGKETQAQFQYIDIGTNIDCKVIPAEGGQFRTELNLERSSAYSSSGSMDNSPESKAELQT